MKEYARGWLTYSAVQGNDVTPTKLCVLISFFLAPSHLQIPDAIASHLHLQTFIFNVDFPTNPGSCLFFLLPCYQLPFNKGPSLLSGILLNSLNKQANTVSFRIRGQKAA